ncbi:MAG: TolC family protein [Sulfuritalea sp.]|nr:TolC family protein [Sulfuritalea sp.]
MNALRWKRQLAAGLAGLALSLTGLAADVAPAASALAAALEQAWRLHPQAAGLDARDEEARAAQDVASGLTPEPGSVSFGSRNDRLNRNLGKQEYEIELAAPLWLPGQKAAREAEAASLVDLAAARRAALRLELAGELRMAWWTLAEARNARALALRRLDTTRALAGDVGRRYKVGELSRIDANLAQTEVHGAESDLIEAEATLHQAEQALRTLTGMAPPAEIGEETPVALLKPDGTTTPSIEHPLLTAAAASARSARARTKVTEESRRAAPELALRVISERGQFAERYVDNVGITLKIPFSSGSQVRREGSAAQAEADQADAEMLRTRTRVLLDIERAQRALSSSQRQLAMAADRRELSAENLKLIEKAFSLGESDLASLLRIRAAAFDAEAFLDRQRVARAAALSQLKQAMGVLP